MPVDILFSIIGGGISIGIAVLAYFLYNNQKKGRYDADRHLAILDEVRNSFEKQIYMLNERLMKSEDRWRDVNHLLIRKEYTDDRPIILNKSVALNDFLITNGVTEKDLAVDKELIFVLTPFNSIFQEDYEAIRKVCTEVGFKCVRGDETYFSSDIFPEMLKQIVAANLVIANLNGRNANVLYELGIAQALNKPVILISRNSENLPIDIKSKRFLIYRSLSELKELLKDELIKLLRNQLLEINDSKVNKSRHEISNIVILSAKYGADGDLRDVSGKVKELVSQGVLEFTVGNWLVDGPEPAMGKEKTLELNCIINGQRKIMVGYERSAIKIE